MKKLILMAMMVCLFVAPVMAQDKSAAPKPKKIKTMVDYKDELGLSDDQIKAVTEALTGFQTTVKTQREALKTQEAEFKALLKSQAPLPDIKAKLRQIADTRFNLRYADVLTSRRVSDTLTADQMKKWREIQAQVRAKK